VYKPKTSKFLAAFGGNISEFTFPIVISPIFLASVNSQLRSIFGCFSTTNPYYEAYRYTSGTADLGFGTESPSVWNTFSESAQAPKEKSPMTFQKCSMQVGTTLVG